MKTWFIQSCSSQYTEPSWVNYQFAAARRWPIIVARVTDQPSATIKSAVRHACLNSDRGPSVVQLGLLWNRSSTLVDEATVLSVCCLPRCCTLRLMSARLRSPMTPCLRCSRFPARLRPFFRCRGSNSIFFGFTHLYMHSRGNRSKNNNQQR